MSPQMASAPTGQMTPQRPAQDDLNSVLESPLELHPSPEAHTTSQSSQARKEVFRSWWFVNAQYRFVMKPTGDYTVHFADPDIFFQWQDILQVIIPRTSALALTTPTSGGTRELDEGLTSCPICLSSPIVPRMTMCGHVFCFPCILHYLGVSGAAGWARCPICFDSVHEQQLKSVKWHEHSTGGQKPLTSGTSSSPVRDDDEGLPAAGSTLRMRLMLRPHLTTLALPRSPTWPSELLPPHQAPFHFLPDVYNFSKDLEALAAERLSLVAMKDEFSLLFIDAAEEKLRHQISQASSLESPHLSGAIKKARTQCEELERSNIRTASRDESRNISGGVPSNVPVDFLAVQRLPPFTPSPSPLLARSPATPGSEATSLTRTHKPRRNLNPPPPYYTDLLLLPSCIWPPGVPPSSRH
ncbi:hypothetical protein EDC04DRAFT_2886641 [Pisolithus marmoratus]|nr:hypothetical protein EDC04DRAFT_2886641 [Pisolithus marmoratus]